MNPVPVIDAGKSTWVTVYGPNAFALLGEPEFFACFAFFACLCCWVAIACFTLASTTLAMLVFAVACRPFGPFFFELGIPANTLSERIIKVAVSARFIFQES